MRVIKGSFIGLVLAGMVMLTPTGVFAREAGGGGHGFGGGHFAAGHFGGGHSGGFAGHSSGFHGGAHYGTHGWHGGHWYGGPSWDGIWWDGDPYWEVDPYYSYYDANSSAYSEAAPLQPEATSSRDTVIAVQQKLARLGYYPRPGRWHNGSENATSGSLVPICEQTAGYQSG